MIERFAVSCTEIDRGHPPMAAFAAVETMVVEMNREAGQELFKAVVEKRDDGAGSLRRDGNSWYRTHPTKGPLQVSLARLQISVRVIGVALPATQFTRLMRVLV